MFVRLINFVFVLVVCNVPVQSQEIASNINGYFIVKEGHHYANKSTLMWGENDETYFSVRVSLSDACAAYNSSSTCDDLDWFGDWNKLWGKNS
jgi:hypothetical protein